ncbi:MAG: amidohydrolase family protein [Cyclobacteriaceae bacterium]|nr:amidohydrolase family protein [Cyclobacteriaceae bacterium]
MKRAFLFAVGTGLVLGLCAQSILLTSARLFDGEEMHKNWTVIIEGERITYAGPTGRLPAVTIDSVIDLGNATLMPGMIEAHGHLLLYPYNEMPWNDQVLKEAQSLRAIRGAEMARRTLLAGYTSLRDLGSEGAGYADVAIRQSIEMGIINGPRMLVAGRAIVATGSYGPKGYAPEFDVPLGAEAADGQDLVKVVRDQIGKGADVIKVYADYRWGINGEAMPTFSTEELTLIVQTAASSGRKVVAHASTTEGMRRATLAGVSSIEHGSEGTPDVFRLMKARGVAFCPTLAATDAITQYRGWKKGVETEPAEILQKRQMFRNAMEAGVTLLAGGDVGVFPHGENAREPELMVAYGLPALAVLRSVTSVNATFLGFDELGKIENGYLADIIAVEGDPLENIEALKKVVLVIKGGKRYR